MKAIVTILGGATALTTLLANGSDSVCFGEAEQEEKVPYVIVDVADIDPLDSIESATTMDEYQMRVFSIANVPFSDGTDNGAFEISKQVRTALDRVRGTYGTEVISSIQFESGNSYTERHGGNKRVVVEHIYRVFKQR